LGNTQSSRWPLLQSQGLNVSPVYAGDHRDDLSCIDGVQPL